MAWAGPANDSNSDRELNSAIKSQVSAFRACCFRDLEMEIQGNHDFGELGDEEFPDEFQCCVCL